MNNKIAPYLFVVLAILLRLIPHVPNSVPVGALALLLGSTLPKKTAMIVTILTMLVTDYIIGFHSVILWVYGSYALITLLPKAQQKMKISHQFSYSIVASLMFYLVTNFGVWIATPMYEKTMSGLLASYWNALPFLRNTMLGDMLYTLVFFALYRVVIKIQLNFLPKVSIEHLLSRS
jgi:hypothetical protein